MKYLFMCGLYWPKLDHKQYVLDFLKSLRDSNVEVI